MRRAQVNELLWPLLLSAGFIGFDRLVFLVCSELYDVVSIRRRNWESASDFQIVNVNCTLGSSDRRNVRLGGSRAHPGSCQWMARVGCTHDSHDRRSIPIVPVQ